MRRSIAGALLLLPLAAAGCGYRLVRHGAEVAPGSTLAVETPSNDSFEPGLEFVVADALRREGLRRGALRLLDDPTTADWVVSGRVNPLRVERSSVSSVLLALEYEVTLELELQAVRRGGEPLGGGPLRLRESERYLASADVEATRKNREEALRRVSKLLATRFYDALYAGLEP